MKRLNKVGQYVLSVRVSYGLNKGQFAFFSSSCEYLCYAYRLGRASMFPAGVVAISPKGTQWVSVGDDGSGNATGWAFVSPYKDLPFVAPVVELESVQFADTNKAKKLSSKLDEYLDYYASLKGVTPEVVVLRSEQLSTLGASPGQHYRSVRLEVYQ